MTQPKNARTAGGKRFYTWRDGKHWSATTVIGGGLPKPQLVPWGIKAVAEGALTNRDVLQSMLKACKTPDACHDGEWCPECEQTVRWLKSVPYMQRDRAADLGTHVHAAAEAYALKQPYPKWPPLVAARMTAYVKFLDDFKPEFEMTEASVYNRAEHYAGTLDAIAYIEGRKVLLDYKTGKGVYPDVALQLAAYRYAEFIGLPDGSEALMPQVDGAAVLHLPAPELLDVARKSAKLPYTDGYELFEVRADEAIFTAFLYVREVFRFQEETSKSVILGPYNELALTMRGEPTSVDFGGKAAGVA